MDPVKTTFVANVLTIDKREGVSLNGFPSSQIGMLRNYLMFLVIMIALVRSNQFFRGVKNRFHRPMHSCRPPLAHASPSGRLVSNDGM
jgi:hypothetical protein